VLEIGVELAVEVLDELVGPSLFEDLRFLSVVAARRLRAGVAGEVGGVALLGDADE
jgi:hypothetical protein